HLEFKGRLSPEDIARITDFEQRVYAAQQTSRVGGDLDTGGATGGPATLRDSPAGRLGSQGVPVWSEVNAWAGAGKDASLPPGAHRLRQAPLRRPDGHGPDAALLRPADLPPAARGSAGPPAAIPRLPRRRPASRQGPGRRDPRPAVLHDHLPLPRRGEELPPK